MRRPQERFSQRRFVFEIRRALDLGREDQVHRLACEHPLALRSAHVRQNLGRARLRALSQVLATPLVGSFDELVIALRPPEKHDA